MSKQSNQRSEPQANTLEEGRCKEELQRTHLTLQQVRDRYTGFYDISPVGFLTLTDKGLISEINLPGAKLFGLERAQILQQDIASFVVPEHINRMHEHLLSVLDQNEKISCELDFRCGDGSSFHSQLDCLRLVEKDSVVVVRAVLTDITERKQKDKFLREQEEYFRMIAENSEDFIAVLDVEGHRLYNNPTYKKLFGDTEELKGTDSFAEIHPDDRVLIRRVFKETVKSGIGMRTDFRFVLPGGNIRHMESRGSVIKDSQGQVSRIIVVSRDITERKLAEDKIHNLAFYDVLTGLPNRRLLNDRLLQSMAASKRSGYSGALMFIDLDNFKPLNDQYGHAAGDLLLEEVARRINSCVREVDTVSRFGGDEFVVLLNELDVDDSKSNKEAGFVAEKIHLILAEPYELTVEHDGEVETSVTHICTSSIGVVLFIIMKLTLRRF